MRQVGTHTDREVDGMSEMEEIKDISTDSDCSLDSIGRVRSQM